jgi:threonine dehydrogenase-like Zn-dependent dehydrogenase
MKALLYSKSIPRWLAMRLLGPRLPFLYTTPLAPVKLVEMPALKLPSHSWMRLRPRLAGVCGSDIATLTARVTPYFSPITSCPFILGHEVVATVGEIGARAFPLPGVAEGKRVVLQPALGCKARGIEEPCGPCGRGDFALCEKVAKGDIAPGIQTGFCRDTGGAFSDEFVAHWSQAFAVPDDLDDQVAVLAEPFSCAIHAVIPSLPRANGDVLVIGAGTMGLLVIAALRAMGAKGKIYAVDRRRKQQEFAREFGADEAMPAARHPQVRYRIWAGSLEAEVLDCELGPPTVLGGVPLVFDCAGTASSLGDALRFTAPRGETVLVGMPGTPKPIDLSPMWHKEIRLRGTYAYAMEKVPGAAVAAAADSKSVGGQAAAQTEGQPAIVIAMEKMKALNAKFRKLTGEPFTLDRWRSAFRSAMHPGSAGVVKTTFRIGK